MSKNLPPKGTRYNLRHVKNEAGKIPSGSSGFAYLFNATTMTISDCIAIGRFWPARYDNETDSFVITGDGRQMKEGQVVEIFSQ